MRGASGTSPAARAAIVAARAAIVAAFVAVFCLLLPYGLWSAGRWLDARFALNGSPSAFGALLAALGLAGMGWSMVDLWRGAHGLPVSALPPPILARRGAYGIVRHPIYLSFNVTVFGAGLALGSPGLAFGVAPLVLPAWLLYARLEERGLLRRFGPAYRRYRRSVGLLPRLRPGRLAQYLGAHGAFGVRVEGPGRLPERGPFVVVCNHCSILDSMYCYGLTPLRLRFLATAEVFRSRWTRAALESLGAVPLRRYRASYVAAYREVLRALDEGAVVGVAPEGERSPWGDYQGAREDVARLLARLGVSVPVIPVGLSGSYDCAPRWSGVVRRRPVVARVGPPVDWRGLDPAVAIDAAIRPLIAADPQPIHLDGLPLGRLERVLWRCPRCGDEARWHPQEVSCANCGAVYRAAGGRFADETGACFALGDLGRLIRAMPERVPLSAAAAASHEPSPTGPIRPLRPIGVGVFVATPEELRFEAWRLAAGRVRSVVTERDDTLQVATGDEMWQFRIRQGSAFRFHRALEAWGYAAGGAQRKSASQSGRTDW